MSDANHNVDLNFNGLFDETDKEVDQLNFWLPKGYKTKFKILQARSQRKFGKLCQSVLMQVIDKADPENAPLDKQAS